MANQKVKQDNTISKVRSRQDLSFNWLGTSDFGRITPFHVQEVIGTDHIDTLKPIFEMQMLPLASPSFSEISVYCHYFYVPTRLLWKHFNDFYSQTGEYKDATPPFVYNSDLNYAYNFTEHPEKPDAPDYIHRGIYKHLTSLGLPPTFFASDMSGLGAVVPNSTDKVTTLPLRAYNQVWWDFFRDPELIPDSSRSQYLRDSDGHEKFHPNTPNEGDTLPFIYYPRVRTIKDCWISELFASNNLNSDTIPIDYLSMDAAGTRNPVMNSSDGQAAIKLRKLEALTRMAERLSLSGKRQIDMLFSQYGIKPEYSKLNMCQYIGGAKKVVLISDITATADTDIESLGMAGTPLGQKAGNGYCQFHELDIDFSVPEPGYIIGVLSVMPKYHFVQGLGKEWFRNTRNDWFKRELEHVGQVAVPKKEVGYTSQPADSTLSGYELDDNDRTFAFTQPYYDYKRKMDVIAGDFAMYYNNGTSDSRDIKYLNSMGLWALYPSDREFNYVNLEVPAANLNKIFYYQGGSVWDDVDDHFYFNINVKCILNRPMDGYAIPTLETTANPHAATTPLANSTVL